MSIATEDNKPSRQYTVKAFRTLLDAIGNDAQKRGLTEEILASLLAEKH